MFGTKRPKGISDADWERHMAKLTRERRAISDEHRRTAEQRHARAINLTGTTAKVVVIGVLLVALLWAWMVRHG